MRRCLKMAAEEPQQQKQEPLGSDSEGTDPGRALRPGLAGAMPGRRFPRRPGAGPPAAGGETHGLPLLPPPPLPLTMEGAAAAATPGLPGRRASERGSERGGPRPAALSLRARPGRGLGCPAPRPAPPRWPPGSGVRALPPQSLPSGRGRQAGAWPPAFSRAARAL